MYELSPNTKSKICKLIGDKCLVTVVINQVGEQVLWDTGAQVSLVDERCVVANNLEKHIRPLHELFDQNLAIKSVSGEELVHVGWTDINVSINCDKQGVTVPFFGNKSRT